MKTSKASKIRQFILENPGMKPAEIASKLKIHPTYVYVVRSQMKKEAQPPEITEKAVTHYEMEAPIGVTFTTPVIEMKPHDPVNNPEHYVDGGVETIDFIEAKGLGYHLGNAVKYISRAGKKGTNKGLEDLKKAQWYIARAIEKNEYAGPSR